GCPPASASGGPRRGGAAARPAARPAGAGGGAAGAGAAGAVAAVPPWPRHPTALDVWPASRHAEALASLGGDHLRIPRRIPDDLHVGVAHAWEREPLAARIGRHGRPHAA